MVISLHCGDHMGLKKYTQVPERGPGCQLCLWEHWLAL